MSALLNEYANAETGFFYLQTWLDIDCSCMVSHHCEFVRWFSRLWNDDSFALHLLHTKRFSGRFFSESFLETMNEIK